jgi:hypothetical protein
VKPAGESFWSLSSLWKLFETILLVGSACARAESVWMSVFDRWGVKWGIVVVLCARVTSFPNSQTSSCRDVGTMESGFMTYIKFELVTNRSVYVKCVYVYGVFRWINCAHKVAVFWVKLWKFCGATLQFVTVTVPAECWPSQWVEEIGWFIRVALKGGWMFVVSFYWLHSCILREENHFLHAEHRLSAFISLHICWNQLTAGSISVCWQVLFVSSFTPVYLLPAVT